MLFSIQYVLILLILKPEPFMLTTGMIFGIPDRTVQTSFQMLSLSSLTSRSILNLIVLTWLSCRILTDAWVIPSALSIRESASTMMHYVQPEISSVIKERYQTRFIENNHAQKFSSNHRLDLKILLIDNHDSYTYNLYQYLSTMTIHPIKVIMNDAFPSWNAFLQNISSSNTVAFDHIYTFDLFDCIIISPGPGQPSQHSDMGIVLETIRKNSKVPILGVCLGHQALGYVYGGEVKLAPCGPVHGLMSSVSYHEYDDNNIEHTYQNCLLFKGLPQHFDVVRYHSLVVQFPSSCELLEIEPIAWCDDQIQVQGTSSNENKVSSQSNAIQSKICMGLRHKKYPHYGVQFHPESIGTGENGYQLLWNFCEFAYEYKLKTQRELKSRSKKMRISNFCCDNDSLTPISSVSSDALILPESHNSVNDAKTNEPSDAGSLAKSSYRVIIYKVRKRDLGNSNRMPMPEQVFEELYKSRRNSFWLDSSTGTTHLSGACRSPLVNDRQSHDNVLQSKDIDNDGCPIATNSRFSIMGSDDGPLSRKIEYFGHEHIPQRRGLYITSKENKEFNTIESHKREEMDMDILAYLRQKLEKESVHKVSIATFDAACSAFVFSNMDEFGERCNDQIPFDYRGGYIGYLGYEVRHDCEIFKQNQQSFCNLKSNDEITIRKTNPNIPTAAFLFADRSLIFDHLLQEWYIVGVAKNSESLNCSHSTSIQSNNCTNNTISWISMIEATLHSLAQSFSPLETESSKKTQFSNDQKNHKNPLHNLQFVPNRSRAQYKKDIMRSHDEIRKGESYELCITNQLEANVTLPRILNREIQESPFEFYKLLRKRNPAPFSAYFNIYPEMFTGKHHATKAFEDTLSTCARVSICCSSPERFLSIRKTLPPREQRDSLGCRDYILESKPIKGTAARYTGPNNNNSEMCDSVDLVDSRVAKRLKESIKDRAENLMIVDLLRNDMGRVCKVGSVHVPKLMQIESYATVHQMVSTVRGSLDGLKTNAIDVIEACFPGGSMTGAPKLRTMEILDEIELGVSRGPYSGCLGYISLNGCMDMNIVIRTAVLTPSSYNDEKSENWQMSIGCGGAITALSNSRDEYEEMILKSKIVRDSAIEWLQTRTKFEN